MAIDTFNARLPLNMRLLGNVSIGELSSNRRHLTVAIKLVALPRLKQLHELLNLYNCHRPSTRILADVVSAHSIYKAKLIITDPNGSR